MCVRRERERERERERVGSTASRLSPQIPSWCAGLCVSACMRRREGEREESTASRLTSIQTSSSTSILALFACATAALGSRSFTSLACRQPSLQPWAAASRQCCMLRSKQAWCLCTAQHAEGTDGWSGVHCQRQHVSGFTLAALWLQGKIGCQLSAYSCTVCRSQSSTDNVEMPRLTVSFQAVQMLYSQRH